MTAPRPRHDLRIAWVNVVLIPASVVLADGVLHAMLGVVGIEEGADEYANLWQALVVGIPYAAVMLAPAVGAFWFGTNAIQAGDRRGRVPSFLGVLWAVLVVLACVVFLFLTLRHGDGV